MPASCDAPQSLVSSPYLTATNAKEHRRGTSFITSGCIVYAIAAILVSTAAYACWCRAPLIWDGAYQFDMTLALQHPYVYCTRFHTWFLWWPTVWASRMTDNVMLLQSLFGLPFLLAPAAGVLLSWWIVREHSPRLVVWAVFGVAVGTLPGQIFVINDSIFQLNIFWPVLFGLLIPLNGPKRIVLGFLSLLQLSHPIGAVLFLGGSAAAAALAIADPRQRRRLLLKSLGAAFLCAVCIAKVWIASRVPHWRDTYAEHEANWPLMAIQWRLGVSGAPLGGLRWMYAAASFALCLPLARRNRAGKWGILAAALLCVWLADGAWEDWSHGPTTVWAHAISYRRWAGPLTAPFFVMAVIDASLLSRKPQQLNFDATLPVDAQSALPKFPAGPYLVALAVTIVYALNFSGFCGSWRRLGDRLMADMREEPEVVVSVYSPKFQYMGGTPASHWSIGNFVSTLQGKQPTRLFLDTDQERLFREHPPRWEYYLGPPDAPPGPSGWFDFRPAYRHFLEQQIVLEPAVRKPTLSP